MDPTQTDSATTTTASAPDWWQGLLTTIVNGAVQKANGPQLQSNTMYYKDNNGNVIPMGTAAQMPAVATPAQQTSNTVWLLAGVAVLGVVLFKLVK